MRCRQQPCTQPCSSPGQQTTETSSTVKARVRSQGRLRKHEMFGAAFRLCGKGHTHCNAPHEKDLGVQDCHVDMLQCAGTCSPQVLPLPMRQSETTTELPSCA
jgi:hypothetical protein